jgi:hypothetical protein
MPLFQTIDGSVVSVEQENFSSEKKLQQLAEADQNWPFFYFCQG